MAFESTLADVPARRACKTILSFAASPHCNRSVPALHSKNFIDRLSREDKYSLSVDVPIHIWRH